MTTSEQINELAAALAKAQGAMGGASKSSANPFFKSKYADLASVWEACRKPLADNGLSILQSPQAAGAQVTVETLLLHASGQWIRDAVTVMAKDDSPQAVGSAITYARRYSLQSFAGVAPEDDDGEAAQGRGNGKQAHAQQPVLIKPPAPKGFEEWLLDLSNVAAEGTARLQKVWTTSKIEYRQYLTAHLSPKWDYLKDLAAEANLALQREKSSV